MVLSAGARITLKQAIPNIFVKDFRAALAYYVAPMAMFFSTLMWRVTMQYRPFVT